ncbi:TonB C-terminal domain-containing protein [Pararhizobium gei]|uniref:TonB C-terminal domain-containing protein n=1 Tax=Pararhizobium gei TaxID=1395951 RepID=UPI0023D9DBF4|nr:TonB C-terminal domain-containing protein [Rhizobium gei]
MKTSLITSAVLHGLVLTWALVSLGSPESFEVSNMEAIPVDMVSVEDITQTQQGDDKAPQSEKPSPVPTKKPAEDNAGENIGENDVDLKTPPKPESKPIEKESTGAIKSEDKPLPTPEPVKEETPEVTEEKPAAEPATEVAALPEPKQEVQPEPKPVETPVEEQPAENPEAEALPDKIPTPMAKPKVEQPAQTAKTPDRKNEENKQEKKKTSTAMKSDFDADEVSALLNKQDSSGGGKKRSTETASLGTKKTTGNTLSVSEMDALRGKIENNWSVVAGIAGAEGLTIKVTMQLDQNGEIIGRPEVVASGGSDAARRTFEGSVRRAIMKSAPFDNLPADKYDSWSEVVVNFDPSAML